MTYSKPYRTATYDRAVAALQDLLKEEGPAQVYRACGDAVAYLRQTPPTTETVEKKTTPDGPLLLDVKDAAKRLGTSYAFLYPLLMRGEIASIKLGSRRKIPYWALPAYLQRLAEQQGADTSQSDLTTWDQRITRETRNPK